MGIEQKVAVIAGASQALARPLSRHTAITDRGSLPESQSRYGHPDKSKFRQSEVPNWSTCRPPSPRPAKTR